MPSRNDNHYHPPASRTLPLQPLYKSFVSATDTSSSSGERSLSDAMANSDGVSDHQNDRHNTSVRSDPRSPTTTEQNDHSHLREDVRILQQKVDHMSLRIKEQDVHLRAQHSDYDALLMQNVSSAAKIRIAEAYKEAADEQYKLGDLLAQKSAFMLGKPLSSTARADHEELDVSPPTPSERSEVTAAAERLSKNKHGVQDEPVQGNNVKAAWISAGVRELTLLTLEIDTASIETFTWHTITMNLGGKQWSPSFYYVMNPNCDKAINHCRAYWLLERDNEPFAPTTPGMHGAKLTAFLRSSAGGDEEPGDKDYHNVPVFVAMKGDDDYTYMGHYTQPRYSDRLDIDSLQNVPTDVLQHWSDTLADAGRQEWMTTELIEHFWPQPRYDGPLPTTSAATSLATAATGHSSTGYGSMERRVQKALFDYAQELTDWNRDSRMRVGKLTPEALMDAFKSADTEATPGLRLNWEYLQCLRWDADFYQRMLEYKHGTNIYGRVRSNSKKKPKQFAADEAAIQQGTTSQSTSGAASWNRQKTSSATSTPQNKPAAATLRVQVGGGEATMKQAPETGYVPPHLRDASHRRALCSTHEFAEQLSTSGQSQQGLESE